MLRRAPSGQGGGNDAAGPWEGRVLATVSKVSLRSFFARAAVLVIAAATLLALTGARSVDAPPAPEDLEQLAQAPVDQPFEFPDTTDEEEDDSDTLDVVPPATQQTQQAAPDTSMHTSPALEDTAGAFRPDLNAVPSAVDTAAVHTGAQPDTLFMPSGVLPVNPRETPPATQPNPQATHPPGPTIPEKKPRTGLFGIHPIAILVGLAALHIAVTHLAE